MLKRKLKLDSTSLQRERQRHGVIFFNMIIQFEKKRKEKRNKNNQSVLFKTVDTITSRIQNTILFVSSLQVLQYMLSRSWRVVAYIKYYQSHTFNHSLNKRQELKHDDLDDLTSIFTSSSSDILNPLLICSALNKKKKKCYKKRKQLKSLSLSLKNNETQLLINTKKTLNLY